MSTSLTVVLIVVAAAALLAGFSKGSLASAIGSLVTPLLALVLPAPIAIGLTLPLFLVGDAFAVIVRWNTWDRRLILMCLPGMLIGVLVGTILLGQLPASLIARILGLGAILYALYRINGWRKKRPATDAPPTPPSWHIPFFSTLSAFASTLANAGGPVFTVFLLIRNETPKLFLGTTALFFAMLNLSKLPAFLSVGVLRPEQLLLIVWAIPLVPFGVWTGKRTDPYISVQTFERIIVLLLVFIGAYLLLK